MATNDAHYLSEEDAELQDVLICIGTGKTVEDETRLRIGTNQLYLKSGEQMARLFPHVPEAIANTVRIADSCELELEFGKSILPEYRPLPEGLSPSAYLRQLCEEGMNAGMQTPIGGTIRRFVQSWSNGWTMSCALLTAWDSRIIS